MGINEHEHERHRMYLEYSGYDTNNYNRPVFGIINKNFTPDPILMWQLPKLWSLEDAATTPLSYLVAYYCLYELTQLRQGIFALIHNGCYPESQAFIDILAAYGAIVYTTVFNEEEFHFAKKRFRNVSTTFCTQCLIAYIMHVK